VISFENPAKSQTLSCAEVIVTNEGVNKPFLGSALTLFVGIVIVGVMLFFNIKGMMNRRTTTG